MQIATGGGQVIMTEQLLECDQIDACFQQMSREAVPKRVDSAGLANHCCATCLVIAVLGARNGYRTGTVAARKQPVLGMVGAPIVAQGFQQGGRQQRIAIFPALALTNPQAHPIRMAVNACPEPIEGSAIRKAQTSDTHRPVA